MESYAQYRMNDWGWIPRYKSLMGKESFNEYVNNVYLELMSMKIGKSFSIDSEVKTENRELFVKIVCMFIQEGNYDYEFSPDYKIVRRNEKTEMVRKSGKVPEGESGEVDN